MQAATKGYVDSRDTGTVYAPTVAPSVVGGNSCADVAVAVSGLLPSDTLSEVTPPGPLGNLSLNAYPSGVGVLTLHLCNAGPASASAPAGTYRLRAMR